LLLGPFEAPDAGNDYFNTDAHYLALAGRIVAELRRRSNLVLLLGDPPPNSLILYRTFSSAAAWWYAVINIACRPELDRDCLLQTSTLRNMAQETGSPADTAEMASGRSPLFIFDDAEKLSDEQLENIYECLRPGHRVTGSGVLLARPAFLTRVERSCPYLLNQGQTPRLWFHELGREEIGPFIRRQLRREREINSFTPEAIAAIAETSGGDPVPSRRPAGRGQSLSPTSY
jgi:hypothetical protein